MKGITISAPTGPLYLQPDRPMPKLRPGYMLVRPTAVALNPADIHILDWGFSVPGALMGCDYAGVVVDVDGSTRGWKKGDRVAGCTRAGDKHEFENGTFADVIAVKADLQLALPKTLKDGEAAALGVNVLTTGRAFYDKFGLPYPNISKDGVVDTEKQPRRQILVYGGSSSMGTMYIQFAKLSYGADHVVDYNSPTAVSDLISHFESNESTMGKLEMVLDSISSEDSVKFCASVLNPTGADDGARRLLSTILPGLPRFPGIETTLNMGYSFLGEPWEQVGKKNPACPEDFESAKRFATVVTQLLALGKIRPHPSDVKAGGLEAVIRGFDEMRQGVSGRKLVFAM